jgi:hypothetical protein
MRDLELKDLITLEKIHAGSCSFPLPNLNDETYLVKKAIDVSGNLRGAAIVRITSEVSLILDKTLTRLERARVIDEVFYELKNHLTSLGLKDTHLFIIPENEDFAAFMQKHFDFVKATGIPLYYEVK